MKRIGFLAGIVSLGLSGAALALPFNDDMVDSQIKTGQVMRSRPQGVVAKGTLRGTVKNEFPLRLEKKEDTANFENPKKGDPESVEQGRVLYHINCTPCHGDLEKVPYETGVAGKKLGAPDLTSELYRSRTDGSIYGTIHFGGMALMPGYGWKLSPSEHWDIINYVRMVQEKRK